MGNLGADRPAGGCHRCGLRVRLAPGEVERLVAEYQRAHPEARLAPESEYSRRLALCANCPALEYGSTCRYCGCLVAVRARLADAHCPAPVNPCW